jgi:hypothetical protein
MKPSLPSRLGLVAIAATTSAQQSPGMSEMRTAMEQAAAAADASDLQQVKTKLQQALNCLVGRDAPEYRPSAGDLCKGASALRNLPNGPVNKIRVQKAIRLASVDVTFHDFKPAHYTAQAVQAVLEEGTQ